MTCPPFPSQPTSPPSPQPRPRPFPPQPPTPPSRPRRQTRPYPPQPRPSRPRPPHHRPAGVAAAATWTASESCPKIAARPTIRTTTATPQSVEPQIIAQQGGRIYGPYTGRYFANRGETDIEHVVARSEAHDSGLCAADGNTRRAFARDLLNLTLASPSVNRHQKVDKDVAQWLPAMNQCWYVSQVVLVKRKYNLSMDQAEATAAQRVLVRCSSTAMQFTDPGSAPAPPPTATPAARVRDGRQLRQQSTRMLRRQQQRPHHLRRSPRTRHRTGAAQPSRLSVHERR